MTRPSQVEMIRNILSVYRQATSNDVALGVQWYPLAHAIVCEWANTFGRSIANVACIIAALSPQIPWTRCLIIADDVLRGNPPSIGGYLHSNLRKAEAIRDDRAHDTSPYFVVGCKVRCFAANLAGDYNIVTVDTHASQIAAGDVCANLRVERWKEYEPVARAYVDCAHTLKLEPAILQAITWCAWKRIYPHKQHIRRTY